MSTQHTHPKQVFRILSGFVGLYTAILIVNLILGVGPNLLEKWLDVSPDVRAYIWNTLTYGGRLAAYILFPLLALRKVPGVNAWQNFFPAAKSHWKDMLFGFLLVTVVLGGFFLAETRLGWLTLEGWKWQQMPLLAWLRAFWTGLLVNICVAVGEETIFRGYLLTSLKSVWGRQWALLAMMVIFGLFHTIAYSESGLKTQTLALAILLAALFGGLFGQVYLQTRSLWLPVSLHFAWNFIENDVLNLTGELDNANLVGALTRLQAPLTAASLGVENVLFIEALAFVLICIGVWLRLRRKSYFEHGGA